MSSFVLYTYVNGVNGLVCHAYVMLNGAALTQEQAQQYGEEFQKQTPGLGFMVLPSEEITTTM